MLKKIIQIQFILLFSLITLISKAQTSNDILNLLIENKTISQAQADSLRADFAIKQQSTLNDKKLKIDFEFRPRSEYRHGYQQLADEKSIGAFFVNQRSRLSFNFLNENKLAVQFSIQDLRVWGQQDPKLTTPSTLQVYEVWVEPYITSNFSIRIGRQKLSFDNQRLFAENNWRVGGLAHDALNFRYNNDKLNVELAGAFNQSAEQVYNTDFKPVVFTNYKYLVVNYFKYKLSKEITLSAINTVDGFQDTKNTEKYRSRFTNGGRVEFERSAFYATLNAYVQTGQIAENSNVNAYYFQPEIRYTSPFKTVIRLGAEIFSGNKLSSAANTDHTFVPLYGSGHTFNGSLDLITKFPTDLGKPGAGLVNPYLFVIHPINKDFELRADFHTFHIKENYLNAAKENINKYLGFENDLLLGYKPNAFTRLDIGFSYAVVSESFEIIKKATVGAHKTMPTWAYISITFKPQLFSTSFK